MFKQTLQQAPSVKVLINIGAGLDIPTGVYVKGRHGEMVLLGGLGPVTAVVGRGNMFKSTAIHYMKLSAMNRIFSTIETASNTYDTETNIQEPSLERFIDRFEYLRDRDILKNGIWIITDKTVYYANKWYEDLKLFLNEKIKNIKNYTVVTPFLSRDRITPLEIAIPTFTEVDSFSEFETEDVAEIQNNNELGDSGGNTIHMRQGLAKTRFLMDVPTLFGKSNNFMLMTAHMGTDIQMAAGPYAAPPPKILQHIKQGEKIKGVTGKFFFLMNNCWHAYKATLMINQGTKGPEYPRNAEETNSPTTDLNLISMLQMRSKFGPSGYTLDLVISQSEGVLPTLTEFHYIKTSDRFGLGGNDRNYFIELYPEVSLSRTTIRGKIDSDPKLCRAINIVSELCQLHQFHRGLREILCTPKELYEGIKAKGYDWNMILSQTRGWWCFEDQKNPLLFLSTLDLVNMYRGTYHPYWMNDDKSIKKEYLHNKE